MIHYRRVRIHSKSLFHGKNKKRNLINFNPHKDLITNSTCRVPLNHGIDLWKREITIFPVLVYKTENRRYTHVLACAQNLKN